jgi:hypothetical protein
MKPKHGGRPISESAIVERVWLENEIFVAFCARNEEERDFGIHNLQLTSADATIAIDHVD